MTSMWSVIVVNLMSLWHRHVYWRTPGRWLLGRSGSTRGGGSGKIWGHIPVYWRPTGVGAWSPPLFNLHLPVGHIISSMGIHHQQYADDTQLFISLTSSDQYMSVARLERCLSGLHEWFCVNGLALNPDKSEAIWLSTHQRSRTLPPHKSVDVAGASVQITDTLKTLGVTLDSRLTLEHHVSSICKSCFFPYPCLPPHPPCPHAGHGKISCGLSGWLSPWLCNSLLYGTSQGNLHKLQRIQNTLAKIVCPGHTHSSDALRFLHWLPVRQRIEFKIASLTFKLLNFDSPNYLECLLKPYLPARALRSHGQRLLAKPHVKTCIGSRAFRVAAPSVWNSLPLQVRSSPSIDMFKRELKTHFFTMKSWPLAFKHLRFEIVFDLFLHLIDIGTTNVCIIIMASVSLTVYEIFKKQCALGLTDPARVLQGLRVLQGQHNNDSDSNVGCFIHKFESEEVQ